MKEPLLFKKGAEAHLYLADWHSKRVIIKRRLPKKYRLPELDEEIKARRTIHEPKLIHEAKKAGVPTPTIFLVDVKHDTIIMEFIDGKLLKNLLWKVSVSERKHLCCEIGRLIGRLHRHGLVHGDLTTSNMILNPEGKIYFLDFGLGEKSKELEARGVDLHLMKRALQSTHFRFARECFKSLIEGYSETMDSETVRDVLDKIKEIERRGRYITKGNDYSGDNVN